MSRSFPLLAQNSEFRIPLGWDLTNDTTTVAQTVRKEITPLMSKGKLLHLTPLLSGKECS